MKIINTVTPKLLHGMSFQQMKENISNKERRILNLNIMKMEHIHNINQKYGII